MSLSTRQRFGIRLREQQARILEYPQAPGLLAVSAVPGSGKTQTLAMLAAEIIVGGHLPGDGGDNEVLVVTLQNSAVDQISKRIRETLAHEKLPPVGFRVCTLHKLCGDILRERQDLGGVDDAFAIVDDAESRRQMLAAAEVWKTQHLAWWESFLPEGSEFERSKAVEKWDQQTQNLGLAISKLSKHLRLSPEDLRRLLDQAELNPNDTATQWLMMGVDLYERYSSYLRAGARLDFDDLIWRAMDALEQDRAFVANLRLRWPFILEDEAQDSSPLQERILQRLAGSRGKWVRVGDPNQAINSTFTSADPRFFRAFLERPDVQRMPLVESGRSGVPIIEVANELVRWVCQEHHDPAIRRQAFELQRISPTQPGDGQVNPPAEECHVHLRATPYGQLKDEAEKVVSSAQAYVQRFPGRNAAVLCPAGWQGLQVLKTFGEVAPEAPVDDLLNSTPKTRDVAKVMSAVCAYLASPTSRDLLARLYITLIQGPWGANDARPNEGAIRQRATALRSIAPAALLFPREPGTIRDLLPPAVSLDDASCAALDVYGALVAFWVRAASLPIDQALMTVAQDLYSDEGDLAICHLLASLLGSAAQMHPDWRMAEFKHELELVSSNKRSMGGLGLVECGFAPQPGRIVVTTLHKAKGLEWDAVYIICAATDEFPDYPEDAYRDEPYFLPGRAPKVEATKLLERIACRYLPTERANSLLFVEDESESSALDQAREEYIAERLRLLYVGITRARRDLSITWSRRNAKRPQRWPLALQALEAYVRADREESHP